MRCGLSVTQIPLIRCNLKRFKARFTEVLCNVSIGIVVEIMSEITADTNKGLMKKRRNFIVISIHSG